MQTKTIFYFIRKKKYLEKKERTKCESSKEKQPQDIVIKTHGNYRKHHIHMRLIRQKKTDPQENKLSVIVLKAYNNRHNVGSKVDGENGKVAIVELFPVRRNIYEESLSDKKRTWLSTKTYTLHLVV